VPGRSCACIFGLPERFIGAKVLEIGLQHALGDQTSLEALVSMADEEPKHQELFRRLHAGPLSRQHPAAGRPVRAVQGRLPGPLGGGSQHAVLDEIEFCARTRA